MSSFDTTVIERSDTIPVLVDFWAPWCGPCQALSPILDQMYESQDGRWHFEKVNIDEQQDVAQRYGVRSIPNVHLFWNRESIAQFSGVQSKAMISSWLNEHLPSKQKEAWKALEQLIGFPLTEDKEEKVRAYLAQYPESQEAKIGLATLLLFHHPQQVDPLVKDIKMGDSLYDKATKLSQAASLLCERKDWHKLWRSVQTESDAKEAFSSLNQLVLSSTSDDKDRIQQLGVALYSLYSSHAESIKKARKIFDMYLTG